MTGSAWTNPRLFLEPYIVPPYLQYAAKILAVFFFISVCSCLRSGSKPHKEIDSIGHIAFFLLDLPTDDNGYVMEQADFLHYYGQLMSWLRDEQHFDVSTHFTRSFIIELQSGKQLSFSEDSFKIKEGIIFVKNSGKYRIIKDTNENHMGLIKEIENYFGVNLLK